MSVMAETSQSAIGPYVALVAMVQWHCRNNNAAGLGPGPPGLVRASLIFTRERTPPPGEAPPPPERLQVWQEECLLSSVAQHQQGRQRQQQAKIPTVLYS